MQYSKRAFRVGKILRLLCSLFSLAFVAPVSLHAGLPTVERGGYFTTAKDLARLRSQASDPRLKAAYLQVKVESDDAVRRWEGFFPQPSVPTTSELLTFGRKRTQRDVAYPSLAIECALNPTSENKRTLREMMLADIGWRQRLNYWHGMGIHDGIATTEFLESYDIGTQLGVFTTEDHAVIRKEMHQAGHFFEGWLLDNSFSRSYADKREEAFCLNFHVYSAAALSWIAMLYPDFPESADWLRHSEAGLVEYLMNGYGEDGGYGEGSVLYWRHSTQALIDFLIVSKNLGVADYLSIPAIQDRLRDTLHWRLDLTAPDGNVFAIGDSERTGGGHSVMAVGGKMLSDPEVLWGARMMFERANHWTLEDVSPMFLAHLDMSLAGHEPSHLSALYPLSGYATFRSGWDQRANALFFKFGTSFIGRREAERGPVISGHSHQDALELELHYHGLPVVADQGRHGRYEGWNTYGGFSKATISHSTVGLGNQWGYDRLDGQYAEHRVEHGSDFTYERTQQNIGRADTHLAAYAELGQVAFSSAKVRTYDAVEHQRSIVWFPDDSLTIVADHLESNEEQPYEWYLTPMGKPIAADKALVFGNDLEKVQILPMLPAGERVTTISQGTKNVPPYYVGLNGTSTPQDVSDPQVGFSLLVLQKKAKTTDFLNVLLPFSEEKNPWTTESVGASAQRLVLHKKEVLVSGPSTDGLLRVDGQCGVVSRLNGMDQTYALIEGTELARNGQTLISSRLKTSVWEGRYSTTVNGLVSLNDKRASFDLKPWPGDTTLLLNPPHAVPGEEPPAPLLIAVSFRVDASPTKMLVLHSFTGELKFNDQRSDQLERWPRDYHAGVYKRQPLPFTYDSTSHIVTVLLEPGEHQLLWE